MQEEAISQHNIVECSDTEAASETPRGNIDTSIFLLQFKNFVLLRVTRLSVCCTRRVYCSSNFVQRTTYALNLA